MRLGAGDTDCQVVACWERTRGRETEMEERLVQA